MKPPLPHPSPTPAPLISCRERLFTLIINTTNTTTTTLLYPAFFRLTLLIFNQQQQHKQQRTNVDRRPNDNLYILYRERGTTRTHALTTNKHDTTAAAAAVTQVRQYTHQVTPADDEDS